MALLFRKMEDRRQMANERRAARRVDRGARHCWGCGLEECNRVDCGEKAFYTTLALMLVVGVLCLVVGWYVVSL